MSTRYSAVLVTVMVALGVTGGCGESAQERDARIAKMTPQEKAAEEAEEAKRKREREIDDREIRAQTIAEEYVSQALAHPLDASFGWSPKVGRNAAGDTFGVSSTVKAKNDFGAVLTYRWEAIVKYEADGWRCLYLTIDGKSVVDKVHEESARMKQEKDRSLSAECARIAEERKAEAAAERKAEAERHRPERAASLLKIAKQFIDDSDREAARKWLKKVIDQYPETDAATEATTLLEESAQKQ